jgi:hypothetical protein
MPKKIYDIDLLDTAMGKIVKSGQGVGRSSTEALRDFSKKSLSASQVAHLGDSRGQYARYQFLHKERK